MKLTFESDDFNVINILKVTFPNGAVCLDNIEVLILYEQGGILF